MMAGRREGKQRIRDVQGRVWNEALRLLPERSSLEVTDPEGSGLVNFACTDFSKFAPHTNATLRRLWAHLGEQSRLSPSAAAWKRMQQSMGLTYSPDGILGSDMAEISN